MNKDGESTAGRIASAIFDLAPIAIEIYDAQGELLKANHKSRAMFGEQGLLCVQGYGLLEGPELSSEGRAAVQQGRQIRYQTLVDFDAARALGRCTSAATGKLYLNVIIEPLREPPEQTVTSYIVLCQDVTERMQVELNLRESEERFRKIFEEGNIGLVLVDRQGRFMRANPAFCAMVGYDEAELLKRTFADVTHPEQRATDFENIKRVAKGELAAYRTEKRYLRRGGEIVWGVLTVSAIRSDRGEFLYFLATVQDITERRLAQEQLQSATERLALATSSGRLGIWDWDVASNVMVWDDQMFALYGTSREQFRNDLEGWSSQLHPEDRQSTLTRWHRAVESKSEWDAEFRIVRPGGRVAHIKANGIVIRGAQGKPVRVIGINADISESKQIEMELRLSQARTAAILDGMADTFYSLDLEWRFVTVNPAAEKAPFGRPAKELLGKVIWDLYPRLLGTRIHQHYLDAAQQRGLEHYEAQSPLNQRWYEVFLQGWSGGVDVYMRDISERKQAEAALAEGKRQIHEALQRLDLAMKSAHLGVWDWNILTNEMVWDDEMLKMYGHTRESFPGGVEAWQNGLHPDDRQRALAECQAALDGIRPYDTEFRIVRPGGEVRTIKADGLVVRDASQLPVRMLGLNRDITEAKRNEAAVRENETIFSTFLEHCPIHVFFKDSQARSLRLSRNYESMLGMPIEKALGKSMDELFPHELAQNMVADDMRILREGRREYVVEEMGDRVFETTKFPIFVEGKAVMLAGFTVDITERKKAEKEHAKLQEQLNQAQKMESVGRLAGGVAHDFNNMLGVMLGNIELALDELDPGSPVTANLHEIHKAAKRSAELTRQLLAFARKQTIAPKVLDLNETVDGMLKMLRRMVGENVELEWTPGEGLPSVHMDPTQLHQILANLCVNARDAIKDVGRIRIATSRIRVEQADCQHNVDALPGEYVMLSVSDDGCGMDRETISKLFEPFFTTKELGRGTGLGLSTVHGIVKQNGGYITVYSEVGQGSVFKVYLPGHQSSPHAALAAGEIPACPGGSETILLVEDEESLLQMSRRILEGLGYRVLCAASPSEALRLAREHGRDIDLLVTDVVMPGMNGRDLADALRAICPHLKRLYVSGYAADVVGHQHVIEEGAAFLQKPFLRNEMAAALRCLLD